MMTLRWVVNGEKYHAVRQGEEEDDYPRMGWSMAKDATLARGAGPSRAGCSITIVIDGGSIVVALVTIYLLPFVYF
jgi:hypothetical protein